ncbi:MAG: protein kinase, partial [Angelakisella sp.]
ATLILPISLVDRYIIISCLKDGMGRRAFLLSGTDGSFILKTQPAGEVDRLEEEYQILEGLSHPGLPRVINCFTEGGQEYLLREYFEGVSLYDYVNRQGPLSESRVLELMRSICPVLHYLHAQTPPIIHRDIKPQNIILTPDGSCKIIDMGTARRYKENESCDTVFMGTQITAPPEQFGYRQTDCRADIYCLGMLMLFLLTGSFEHGKRPPTISRTFWWVISRCLAFDPRARFGSVRQLERCLFALRKRKAILGTVLAAVGCLMVGGFAYAQAEAAKLVQFQNPIIDQAVRLELAKGPDEPILKSEAALVKSLYICGNTIMDNPEAHSNYCGEHWYSGKRLPQDGTVTDLSDVAKLTGLENLILDGQQITDVTQLSELPLRNVSLCANQITEITPLAGCAELTSLRLEGNPIDDISVVAELPNLTWLDINHTRVTDISPIAQLPIKKLYFVQSGDTVAEDYSALTKLQLTHLYISNLSRRALDTVYGMTSLKKLTIYNSGIEDISLFNRLTQLEELDIAFNDLSGLEGIGDYPALTYLGVEGNADVKSIAPITKFRELNNLRIGGCPVTDPAPLLAFPKLQSFSCGAELAAKLDTVTLPKGIWLEVKDYS